MKSLYLLIIAKNIKKNNNSLIKEISIVAIHGILHLIDYDHDNKINEKIMFDLQKIFINLQGSSNKSS